MTKVVLTGDGYDTNKLRSKIQKKILKQYRKLGGHGSTRDFELFFKLMAVLYSLGLPEDRENNIVSVIDTMSNKTRVTADQLDLMLRAYLGSVVSTENNQVTVDYNDPGPIIKITEVSEGE